MSGPAQIVKGTALVPARPVAEALGASVAWEQGTKTVKITGGAAGVAAAPAWPWPYKKLDPEVVAQKGYDGYYKGACCYGAFNAIVSELAKVVGFPYTMMPTDMFRYGEGGIAGWSTICGALNGACAAINLVVGEKDVMKLVDELMGWYTTYQFPNFKPVTPKVDKELVTNAAGSTLCHVSVTNWCKVSGYGAKSPERSERCGRLTGDVVKYAVQLLNDYTDGKFAASYLPPASIGECMGCHGDKAMNNTRGKQDCVQCHDLPNPKPPHK
ncbi:hypothetical protein SY88_16215 [Clostridiales bacterium PH28_bin88]|nr:hypothetical protein SY88_16215 [Clostridiales bacterium PH28_bin88]